VPSNPVLWVADEAATAYVCPGARYLPPKTELVVCCRLTQLQKELYLTLLDSKVRARVRIRVRVKVSYRRSFT
jgi:hypothetical protein